MASFCRASSGATEISFMGALVTQCLKRIRPEYHSVNEYMNKAGSANDALLKVFREEDMIRFSEAHVRQLSLCDLRYSNFLL